MFQARDISTGLWILIVAGVIAFVFFIITLVITTTGDNQDNYDYEQREENL